MVVAVGGVAVGTAALLLSLMIVRGFGREIETKLVGFGQHVQVTGYVDEPLDQTSTLVQEMEAWPEVDHVQSAIIEFALLRGHNNMGTAGIEGLMVWGTDVSAQPFIREHIQDGAFSFQADTSGKPGVVLGNRLAEKLNVVIGNRVTMFSTKSLREGGGGYGTRPRVRQYVITGLFDTGFPDLDEQFVYVDIEEARDFFQYTPDQSTRIDLTLTDISQSTRVAQEISNELGPPVFARSIYQTFSSLFAWVDLQQSIIPLLISVLGIVAAFNIVGTLLLLILDKSREIGILLGMGSSRQSIRRMYLWLGALIGLVGSCVGITMALGFAFLQIQFGIIPLPAEAYYIDHAPVELRLVDFLIVPLVAIFLCTLAAYLPARTASRIEPLRTIRFGA